jgi:hypothetical protein
MARFYQTSRFYTAWTRCGLLNYIASMYSVAACLTRVCGVGGVHSGVPGGRRVFNWEVPSAVFRYCLLPVQLVQFDEPTLLHRPEKLLPS